LTRLVEATLDSGSELGQKALYILGRPLARFGLVPALEPVRLLARP
jgi:hypothetical protein